MARGSKPLQDATYCTTTTTTTTTLKSSITPVEKTGFAYMKLANVLLDGPSHRCAVPNEVGKISPTVSVHL